MARLLPAGSPLTLAVDDTLFKRSGKKVFGVAWHHDGAAKGPKPIGFGNCWVVAGIVVQLSFLSRPVCLPVLARLWRGRHNRASTGRHTGRDRNDSCTTMPATTQQLPNRWVSGPSPPRRDARPPRRLSSRTV